MLNPGNKGLHPGGKRFLSLAPVLMVSLFLMGWGYHGHYRINISSVLSFHPEMEQFANWAEFLAEHASDADYRKETDPEEGPRHYIDIDNYPGFSLSGRIPQTYDSVVNLYGLAFVIDQGILPWATMRTYDSLVSSFARFDWEKAKLFASDLGHYVADAHNPLHLTRNYNGQYTGNYNIHSRFETGMINRYEEEIVMEGREAALIPDVRNYIFGYIYSSYSYVDSILLADDIASAEAGNTSSNLYYEILWEHSRSFTIPLFNRASAALSELVYTAWVEAGKPDPASGPGIFEHKGSNEILKVRISPNPMINIATVCYSLPGESAMTLKVMDINGEVRLDTALNEIPAGDHEMFLNLSALPEGIYLLLLNAGSYSSGIKFIKAAN